MTNNPLLQSHGLIPYADIRLEHLEPAVSQIIADCRNAVETILSSQLQQPTWNGLVLPMADLNARIAEVSGILVVLDQIPQLPEWQAASGACRAQLFAWETEISQHTDLFNAYQALANSEAAQHFSAAQTLLLNKKMNAFRASGVNLPDAQKSHLTSINEQIQGLEESFYEHVLAANGAWEKHITDDSQLAGLSQTLKNKLAKKATMTDREGWLLTLEEEALYNAVLSQCENRDLRKELWTAYSTRASDTGPNAGQHDNGPVLEQLLALRHQKAALLGYENYAQLSLQTKMATSTEQVLNFLRARIRHERPQLEMQARLLRALAETLGYTDLGPWDYPYLAQRISAQKSSLSAAELNGYFPFQHVLEMLVDTVQRLFGIQLVPQQAFSTWHPDVRLFEVRDADEVLGHIYVDPYLRTPKLDGCWAQPVRNRRVDANGQVTLPAVIFHGNFSPAEDGAPTLLSHLQMSMLFHEFGHCLQHVLTRCPLSELSGITSLSLDASEFAGKMLEQWCWSRECLLGITRHHQTRHALNAEQIDAVLDARKVTLALRTADELMRALFDFELHRAYGDGRTVQNVLSDARAEAQPLHWPENDRFANGFDYMVTGYDAGYYVYEWSETLAQQVFSKFAVDGVFNPHAGMAFREAFYTPGGERTLLESFARFMGSPATGI